MDQIFKDLEKEGKTDVENLIKWMKDSKIIDPAKNEKEIRQLFDEVGAKNQVELQKFKEIVAKLAAEQSKTLDQLSKQLATEAPKIIDAAVEVLEAFKQALKNRK